MPADYNTVLLHAKKQSTETVSAKFNSILF